MNKFLIILLFIPLLIFSHIQDKDLFSTSDIKPGALILLDRSLSMDDPVTETDTSVTVGETDVVLNDYSWNNDTELEGWYDSEIFPDGPGEMTDFEGAPGDTTWTLTINGVGSNDTAVVHNWILRIYHGGSFSDFAGGSFGLRILVNEVSDVITVTGVGTVDSVECFIGVSTYGYWTGSGWRRRWVQTELEDIMITLSGPSIDIEIDHLTRIQAALKVIHSLLDADGDGFVTEDDEELLPIELGQGCHRTDKPGYVFVPNGSYTFTSSSWNPIQKFNETTRMWDDIPNGTYTMYTDAIGSHFVDMWNHVNYTDFGTYTPNGMLIGHGVDYIRTYRTGHPDLWCMKQNIILITDGEPNTPRETCTPTTFLSATEAAYNAGARDMVREAYLAWHGDSVRVFAVGFSTEIGVQGANSLNWTARWGGTCADRSAISGDSMAVNPASGCPTANPRDSSLSGYAYIADDAQELAGALREILTEIAGQKEKAFSSAEVTSIEEDYTTTEYEARMYLASFYPEESPFWEGHLRSVRLVEGGISFENIPDSLLIWDAGDLLRERDPDTRNIYGIKSSSIQEFNSSNFSATDLAVGSSVEAAGVVNFVRSGAINPDTISYLGDIFHSSPLRVASPSYWYRDDGFAQYRDNVSSRASLIYAGSNTGMLHAFYDETGDEAFAVVPENFVSEVKALADSHRFYVDADPMAADVWFPSEPSDTFKNADEWKTVLMACQGEGGRGITCLDVTDPSTLPPGHLFSIYDTTTMGYTTSVPVMFKVGMEVGTDTVERFLAFFGGGEWPESMYDIYSPGSEVRGNVIVALDIYGAYTSGLSGSNYLFIPAASGDESKMVYPFASAASVVNLNSRYDNLYDLLYIPDLAGQLWKVDLTDPNISNWRARCIFQPPIPADSTQDSLWQPAFYAPLVEREPATGCLWLFYGTGDRAKIFKTNTDNRFYAILDTLTDTTDYPLTEDNLKRVWTEGPFDFPSEFPDFKGWYIVYSDSSTHNDEKTVSQASLFLDTLKFVTFEPTEFVTDCNMGSGGAREYSCHFRTGSGRYKNMGSGIPQAPRYSFDQSGSGYEIHQTSDSLWVERKTGFGTLKRILQWKER